MSIYRTYNENVADPDTVLVDCQWYLVSVETPCAVNVEATETYGAPIYGYGTVKVICLAAQMVAPSHVDMLPEGGNGTYLCLDSAVRGWAGAYTVVSRWLESRGYRDADTGRITSTGRDALYSS